MLAHTVAESVFRGADRVQKWEWRVMRKLIEMILVGALATFGQAAAANSLECVVTKKFSCSSEQCNEVLPTIRNSIDLTAKTYARCDTKGCDTYPAVISVSGVMTTIDLPGRGTFARLTASNNSFVEVTALLTNVLVSYGVCR